MASTIHGRPLLVDETSSHHVAEHILGTDVATFVSADAAFEVAPAIVSLLEPEARARYTEHFTKASLEEHASVAAFARTICELMALGAPSSLLKKTQAALADEIAHAEACFAWLAALEGKARSAGPLEAAVAPLRSGPELAANLLRDVFVGGCLGQTLAACRAAEHAMAADAPQSLRLFFDQVANDEARHAALAFETVRWLLSLDVRTDKEDMPLHRIVKLEIARFRRRATPSDRASLEPLFDVLLRESS